MKYHFVLGEEAATPIMEAISLDEQLQGSVCVLKDQLNVGPLSKAEEDASSTQPNAGCSAPRACSLESPDQYHVLIPQRSEEGARR